MKFKKGDRVTAIDENLDGTVVKTDGEMVTISIQDGFELEFHADTLILNGDGDLMSGTSYHQISQSIHEKETFRKKKPVRKGKERFQPTMEVDLHIHKLTNTVKGMTKHDMLTLQLDTAKRQLDFAIQKRIQKVVFIHGVGEGVLRVELEYLFNRYENLKFYDANYQKYGLGATEVYIFQNV